LSTGEEERTENERNGPAAALRVNAAAAAAAAAAPAAAADTTRNGLFRPVFGTAVRSTQTQVDNRNGPPAAALRAALRSAGKKKPTLAPFSGIGLMYGKPAILPFLSLFRIPISPCAAFVMANRPPFRHGNTNTEVECALSSAECALSSVPTGLRIFPRKKRGEK